MKLSATGRRWHQTMRRIFAPDVVNAVVHRAEGLARLRGGREITRDDLCFAAELIAKEREQPEVKL